MAKVRTWVLPILLAPVLALVTLHITPAHAERRLGLIITNQKYPTEIGTLAHTHKDGASIEAALSSVGFKKGDVVVRQDLDQAALRQAISDLIERAELSGPDTVVFFYYSGHGAADRTDRGENYLIPVGANITAARQLPIQAVGLGEITRALDRVKAKARFVVVDACRNVAFTKGLKDAAKGFVPERKLDGMIVAFATRPGETAEDNNVYSSALAEILPSPGLEAEQVFKETQRKVADQSKGRQIPWTEDGLLVRFRFKEALEQQMVVTTPPASAPAPAPPVRTERPAPKKRENQEVISAQFDGSWKITWTSGSNCPDANRTESYFVHIRGGKISVRDRDYAGSVLSTGEVNWQGNATKYGGYVKYSGKLQNRSGLGQYYNTTKGCGGSFIASKG